MYKIIKKLINKIVIWIGNVHWASSNTLSGLELDEIEKLLTSDYYIILTRRKNHLSTYFVSLLYLFLKFKFGYYAHALMNLEDEINDPSDFRLIEATGKGVHYSPFDKVFECHSVALLRPKNMTLENWTYVMDKAKKQLGKKYDSLFDLKSDKELSCVELVRVALQTVPDYETKFANFEKMIKENKNLHPQMFYDCEDFYVEYEVRK